MLDELIGSSPYRRIIRGVSCVDRKNSKRFSLQQAARAGQNLPGNGLESCKVSSGGLLAISVMSSTKEVNSYVLSEGVVQGLKK